MPLSADAASSTVSGLLKLLKLMLSSARPIRRVSTVLSMCFGNEHAVVDFIIADEFDLLEKYGGTLHEASRLTDWHPGRAVHP